ncbi:MAG: amidohydrolase family protein, partial [Methermicoccaceae archaeon]
MQGNHEVENSFSIGGTILVGPDLQAVSGWVHVRDGKVEEIEEGNCDEPNLILPPFFNAHTHLGDSIIKDPPLNGGLDALVMPPNGLKHRALRDAAPAKIVDGMCTSIEDMLTSGCSGFADFREEGVGGVRQLREAIMRIEKIYQVPFTPLILGRPARPDFSDIVEVVDTSDGIGMSGFQDIDTSILEEIRILCREKKKPFCIHAGEKSSEDIDGALSLEPDVLIHMVHAEYTDLEQCANDGVGVVICPRSNLSTGVGTPPLVDMLDVGVKVGLGTDNVMLASSPPLDEMHTLAYLYPHISEVEMLKMATVSAVGLYSPWMPLNHPPVSSSGRLEMSDKGIVEGEVANMMVVSLDGVRLRHS